MITKIPWWATTRFSPLSSQLVAQVAAPNRGMNYITFTSWCNFGLYDIDFGWGKPIWVSLVGSNSNSTDVLSNLVLLMDTRSGDGIEAWVLLDKEDMIVLGQDKELLAFASLDTSPIN